MRGGYIRGGYTEGGDMLKKNKIKQGYMRGEESCC